MDRPPHFSCNLRASFGERLTMSVSSQLWISRNQPPHFGTSGHHLRLAPVMAGATNPALFRRWGYPCGLVRPPSGLIRLPGGASTLGRGLLLRRPMGHYTTWNWTGGIIRAAAANGDISSSGGTARVGAGESGGGSHGANGNNCSDAELRAGPVKDAGSGRSSNRSSSSSSGTATGGISAAGGSGMDGSSGFIEAPILGGGGGGGGGATAESSRGSTEVGSTTAAVAPGAGQMAPPDGPAVAAAAAAVVVNSEHPETFPPLPPPRPSSPLQSPPELPDSGAAAAAGASAASNGSNGRGPAAASPDAVTSGGGDGRLSGFRERLRDLRELFAGTLEGLWRSLDTWYTRLAFVVGLMCVIVTAVVNAVLVPVVNVHVMPAWEQRAAVVLQRDVSLGRIRWLGLGGVTGVVPLVRLGPAAVGPRWSGAELSHVVLPAVALYLEPLTSLVYRQAVLRLHLEAPQVTVVQGRNFSWFGYPEDTSDNARNFVPGLGSEAELALQDRATTSFPCRGPAAALAGADKSYPEEQRHQQRQQRTNSGGARNSAVAEQGPVGPASLPPPPPSSSPSAAAAAASGAFPSQGQGWGPATPPLAALVHSPCPSLGLNAAPEPAPSTSPGTANLSLENRCQHQRQQLLLQQLIQQLQQHLCEQLLQPRFVDWVLQPLLKNAAAIAQGGYAAPVEKLLDPSCNPNAGTASYAATAAGPSAAAAASAGPVATVSTAISEGISIGPGSGTGGGDVARDEGLTSADAPRHLTHSLASTGSTLARGSVRHSQRRRGGYISPGNGRGDTLQGTGQAREEVAAHQLQSSGHNNSTPVDELTEHAVLPPSAPSHEAALVQVASARPPPAPPLASVSGAADAARVLLRGSSGGGGGSRAGSGGSGGSNPAAAAAAFAAELEESLPPVALGSVTVRNASLRVFIIGELLPRRFDYVSGSVMLGRNYRSVELAVEGDAYERPAASAKCTLINPNAKRHLRHVTPGAAALGQPPRRFGCDSLPRGTKLALQSVSAVSELAAPPLTSDGRHRHHLHQHHRYHPQQQQQQGHDVRHVQVGSTSHQQLYDSQHRSESSHEHAGKQQDLGGTGDGLNNSSSGSGGGSSSRDASVPEWISRYSVTVRPQRSKFSNRDGLQFYSLHTYSALLPPEEWEQQAAAAAVEATRGVDGGVCSESPGKKAMAAVAAVERHRDQPAHVGATRPVAAVTTAATKGIDTLSEAWVKEGGGGSSSSKSSSKRRRGPANQPTGGHITVSLASRGMNVPGIWPDLSLTVRADRLHAPLLERLLELPMDIHDGRVDGELKLRAYDASSWQFPELYGRIKCRGASLHFWDSPDDISGADMDLVLERDRMYLLGAVGRFGAVPITITGDMDLNPDTGTYRLQSNVPGSGVEINALRATLGVRPIPISAAGAVRGVLHCTGPLERPIFSGTAIAVRPSQEQLAAGLEDTLALMALRGHSTAVAAYDKVPLLSAQAVFTLDMATQMLNLHSVQVQPDGGGSMLAAGRMWLAPEAETDPRAISVSGEASGLDADRLARYYLPTDVELPDGVQLGNASVRGVMAGSHLAPAVELTAEAPAARICGSASFSQKAISTSARSPAFSVNCTVRTSLPYFDELRSSDTQAEASYYARPRFMGADLELHCAAPGADLLPLATGPTTPPPFDPLAANQPLHLRVAGHARLALRPVTSAAPPKVATAAVASAATVKAKAAGPKAPGVGLGPRQQQQQQQLRQGANSPSAAPALAPAVHDSKAGPKKFEGTISLSGVRINSLELVRSLSGSAAIDGEAGTIAVRARGPGGGAGAGAAATAVHTGASIVVTGSGAGAGTTAAAATALGGGAGSVGQPTLAADVLDFELAVPDLMAALNLEPASPPPPAVIYWPTAATANAGGGGIAKTTAVADADGTDGSIGGGRSRGAVSLLLPASTPAATSIHRIASARTAGTGPQPPSELQSQPWSRTGSVPPPAAGISGGSSSGPHPPDGADSRFLLSRGPLLLEAEVANGGSEVSVQIANLQLDDLEAGSLRGSLRSASLVADVAGRRGRGSCSAEGLRLSSLAVGSFGGAVRWEGDIVKLEETVLVQRGSRYEVSGEVFLPGFGAAPAAASQNLNLPTASGSGTGAETTNNNAAHAVSHPIEEGEALDVSVTTVLTRGSSPLGRNNYRPTLDKHGGANPSTSDPWVSAPAAGSRSVNGGGGNVTEAAQVTALSGTAVTAEGTEAREEEVGASDCRWRLQINVPSAQISDLLPAVQLATSASRPGTDYGAAKARFLEAIQSGAASAVSPPDVRLQVDLFSHLPKGDIAAAGGPTGRTVKPWRTHGSVSTSASLPSADPPSSTSSPAATSTTGVSGGRGTSGAVPALSELSGGWSGNIQLHGGLSGPSTVDFSLAGRDWRWGPSYRLDRLVAVGSADAAEGVALEELAVDAGPARLRASGSLLCPRQDAHLALYDFPLDAFAPITNTAWPALERAAAAAKARGAAQTSPLAALGKRLDATLQNLGLRQPGADGADGDGAESLLGPRPPGAGPVGLLSGLLFVEGSLAGSVSRPQASVLMRVEDGAIGGAQLGRAQARLEVDPQQRLHVEVDVAPRSPRAATTATTVSAAASGAGGAGTDTSPMFLSYQQQLQDQAPSSGYVRLVGSAKLPAAAAMGTAAPREAMSRGSGAAKTVGPAGQVWRRRLPVQARMRSKETATVSATAMHPQQQQQQQHFLAGVPGIHDLDADSSVADGAVGVRKVGRTDICTDVGFTQAPAVVEAAGGDGDAGASAAAVAALSDEFGSESVDGAAVTSNGVDGSGSATTETYGELTPVRGGGGEAAAAEKETLEGEEEEREDVLVAALRGQELRNRRAEAQQRRSDAPEEEREELDGEVVKTLAAANYIGPVAVAEAEMLTESTDASAAITDGQEGSEDWRYEGDKQEEEEEVEVEEDMVAELHVRDGGMVLLAALVPDCEWKGGGAKVDLRVHGKLQAPQVEGRARVTRGSLLSPLLRYPVTNLNADIQFDGHTLIANSVDASLGKTGSFRVRGALPVQTPNHSHHTHRHRTHHHHDPQPTAGGTPEGGTTATGLVVEVDGAEVRARGVYSGVVDGRLVVRRSLAQPLLGGRLRFSKGVAYLLPQQGSAVGTSGAAPSTSPSPSSDRSDAPGPHSDSRGETPEVVRAAFSLLKAGRKRALLEAGARPGAMAGGALAVEEGDASGVAGGHGGGGGGAGGGVGSGAGGPAMVLSGLEVALGPDLRALFPVVLNLGLSGSVTLNGPADPERLQPVGTVHLESGTLNLVATQFVLDREHDNRIIFALPEPSQPSQQQQLQQPSLQSPQPYSTQQGGAAAAAALSSVAPSAGVAGSPAVLAPTSPATAGTQVPSSVPAAPIDPIIDLVLVSGDLRASIQGRSSSWQEGLSLTASGTPLLGGGTGGGGGGVGPMSGDSLAAALIGGPGGGGGPGSGGGGPGSSGGAVGGGGGESIGEAARILEERLADALLGEKGQLALRSLARSTVSSLLPRIETRGQLGNARWRLVGAPSLPSLMSLPDPVSEPSRFLSTLALGTEVEVAFGKRLQASLSHKLQELGRGGAELPGGGGGTEARVSLQLTSRLRLQAHLARGALLPSVTLQYSSEGGGGGGGGGGTSELGGGGDGGGGGRGLTTTEVLGGESQLVVAEAVAAPLPLQQPAPPPVAPSVERREL